MSSMEQRVQGVKDVVARIGDDFTNPEDDWAGMMIFDRDGGYALMPLMFDDDDSKDFYATVFIPMVIRQQKPWLVCQLQSAWTVAKKMDDLHEDLRDIRPSQHPEREECLILIAVAIEQVQFWMAKIIRFKNKPPKLAPWTLQPHDSLAGRFIDPIVETMKEVHGE